LKVLWFTAVAALLALIALCLAWELSLAPIRSGGSWLVLKALPLLVPLRGMLHGRRYTYQWVMFLALAYAAEGSVRAWSEAYPVRPLALAELALALLLFACSGALARRLASRS
jgi:uncharacterized membrane protein